MEKKPVILIADDEIINLEFFELMLSKLGFHVEKAQDGEAALMKVTECHPDLLLLDNVMPKMSGWKVTEVLKTDERYAEFKDIPIIMLSALDNVKDKVEGYDLGIEDYIIKPFNFTEVLARIRNVLRHKELSDKVLNNERHIAHIESLNDSLVYFTDHLKNPVLEIQEKAGALKTEDIDDVRSFQNLVLNETEKVLAVLSALKEEIDEMKQNSQASGSSTIQALDEKFQKHVNQMKEGVSS